MNTKPLSKLNMTTVGEVHGTKPIEFKTECRTCAADVMLFEELIYSNLSVIN
jgi:hypothetical protein